MPSARAHPHQNAADATVEEDSHDARGSSKDPRRLSVRVPRYIPLPDSLYNMRRRFPGVLDCVMLECVRCRQWAPVEVLRAIPSEVADVTVVVAASSADDGPVRESKPSEEALLTFARNPMNRLRKELSDAEQQRARALKESRKLCWALNGDGHRRNRHDAESRAASYVSASSEEDDSAGAAAAQQEQPLGSAWHSSRLRAQQQQQQHQQGQSKDALGAPVAAAHGGRPPHISESDRAVLTASERSLMSRVLAESRAAGEQRAHRTPCATTRPTELYIPNPAVFTCPWEACQQADVLLDLRQRWLGELQRDLLLTSTLPVGGAADATTPASVHAHAHASASGATQPVLSPTPEEVDRACDSASAQLWAHRHALNDALARELHLRRSERLAERRAGTHRMPQDESVSSHSSGSGGVDGEGDADSTAASGARGRGGLTAALQSAAHQLFNSPTRGAETALAAFCWVACDRCGKLRRLAQPFPGGCGAPFLCALAAGIGSCDVSESAGLVRSTAALAFSQEEEAVDALAGRRLLDRMYLASSILPEPLRSQCERVHRTSPSGAVADAADRDPLLQLISNDATGRALQYVQTHFPASLTAAPRQEANRKRGRPSTQRTDAATARTRTSHDADNVEDNGCGGSGEGDEGDIGALPLHALPALAQLSAFVKRRALGSVVKRVMLTPREVRQKREEVLRTYLYEEKQEEPAEPDGPPGAPVNDAAPTLKSSSAKAVKGCAAAASRAAEDGAREEEEEEEEEVVGSAPKRRRSSAAAERRQRRAARRKKETVREPSPADQTDNESSSSSSSSSSASDKESGRTQVRTARKSRGLRANAAQQTVAGTEPSRRRPGRPPKHRVARPPARAAKERLRKGRVQRPESHAGAASAADRSEDHVEKEEEEGDVIHWVQCDRCGKWRVVPSRIPSKIAYWECSMRQGARTTCADTDDEERMKAEGRT